MTKKIFSASMILFLSISLISMVLLKGETTMSIFLPLITKESGLSLHIFVDKVTLVMIFVVSLVSFSVFSYSMAYMESEAFKKKFIITLFMFVMSMYLLVLSSDLFWVMVGWDGLGLTSFFLIIYFQNWKSFNSGMTTFLANRLGDGFLLSSIAWCLSEGSTYFSLSTGGSLIIAGFFFLIGAISKSAQLPFSSWLPLAMAAPTPVSALVHSSTLVTAGVFLLIRFKDMLTESTNFFLLFVSSLTIIFACSSSIGQYDLKKIIALSTLSHISLMLVMISISAYDAALFHLAVHAFFKSLLFMVAGNLIHHQGIQDIRTLSVSLMDFPLGVSLISSLVSMAGIPFFSGFISKEVLLETVGGEENLLPMVVFFVSAGMTSAYSIRILFYLLKVKEKESDKIQESSGWKIFFLMVFFCLGSTCLMGVVWKEEGCFSLSMKTDVYLAMILGGITGISVSFIQGKFKWMEMFSEMWWLGSLGFSVQSTFFISSFFSMFKIDFKGILSFVDKVPEKGESTWVIKMQMVSPVISLLLVVLAVLTLSL